MTASEAANRLSGTSESVGEPVAAFKALADELRLAALLLIHHKGPLCVCEVMAAFEAPQPKVSRHLATLREAGWLQAERRGQWMYYRLNPAMAGWMQQVLAATANAPGHDLDRLLARLDAMSNRPGRCN